MKRKRMGLIVRLLCILTAFSLTMAACSGQNEGKTNDQTQQKDNDQTQQNMDQLRDLGKITLALPDWSGGKADNPEENKIVLDAIKKKFMEDKQAKIDIEVVLVPGSQYINQMNIKLAAGEKIDAFRMFYPAAMSDYATKAGMAQPLDELIDKFGPNIKKNTKDYLWNATRYNGFTWAIPQEGYSWQYGLVIRKDLLDQAGLDIPKNITELETAFAKFKEMGYIPYLGAPHYTEWYLAGLFGMQKPYGGGLANAIMDDNDNIIPIFTEPKYVGVMQTLQRWVANGWLAKEYLTGSTGAVRDSTKTGKVASSVAAVIDDPALIFYQTNLEIDPKTEWVLVPMFEGSKYAAMPNIFGAVVINGSSKNAQAVVEYLDWLYADPKNYMMALKGVEGVHYTADWDKMEMQMIGKYADPAAPIYQGVYAIDMGLQLVTHPDLRLVADMSTASPLVKRQQEYLDKYRYGYMMKLDDNVFLRNPLEAVYMDISDSLKSKVADFLKEYSISRVILGDITIEDFKKEQEKMLKEWQEKYQPQVTNIYKAGLPK